MSFKEVTMYQVECDGCGSVATEGADITAWDDKPFTEHDAIESFDYIKIDGKHYCPDCTEWNEDESERVKKAGVK